MITTWRWIIKKNINIIILAVSLSLVFTKALFSTYSNEQQMISDGNIYYLQYGVFTKENVMKDVTENLDNYFVKFEDNKYYVYLGAYTILQNAIKYQKILENNKIYTYIKNDYLNNGLEEDIKKIENDFPKENNELEIKNINNKIIKLFQNRKA